MSDLELKKAKEDEAKAWQALNRHQSAERLKRKKADEESERLSKVWSKAYRRTKELSENGGES